MDWLAREFERRTGIRTTLYASLRNADISKPVQLAAYRTAQEALTNISKHAQCSEVRIELSDAEGVLTLEIADNGRGIRPAEREKPQSFGLKGLQERARSVGGWLDISSRSAEGTSITLTVPLSTQPSDMPQDVTS